MDFIYRHAEETIKSLADSYPSILVTGARQTGKTTLLQKITDALFGAGEKSHLAPVGKSQY